MGLEESLDWGLAQESCGEPQEACQREHRHVLRAALEVRTLAELLEEDRCQQNASQAELDRLRFLLSTWHHNHTAMLQAGLEGQLEYLRRVRDEPLANNVPHQQDTVGDNL